MRGLTLALVVLTVGQVMVPVLINRWSAAFFDALEQKSMEQFFIQIGALAGILLTNVTVTATHLRVKRRIQVGWRKWVTRRVLHNWMSGGLHYQITHMEGEHDNPDGRIAEDIRNATESAIDLAHSLFYVVLLLISFTQILWSLSGTIMLDIGDFTVPIHGDMVWIALLYASAGTTAALLLARPMVKATNLRQTVEANFRFGLVRVRENSEAIALMHGEGDERRRLREKFRDVVKGWDAQTNALTRIFLFSSGYQVLSTAFPVLVAAPRYIAGTITLGTLMQTAQAFQQMAAALSWPIDNISKAAEWKATVERVLSLTEAVEKVAREGTQHDGTTIAIEQAEGAMLAFKNVCIASPHGEVIVTGLDAEIQAGERVLISGDPASAVKLFKVVAGLWPWGRGRVELPRDASIFFMPQRPYLPIGTMREAVCYPSWPDDFDKMAVTAAMRRVGLAHLIPRLNDTENWENALSVSEQQRIGFARLLLQQPDWVFLEEATDALESEGEEEMMRLIGLELPSATVLTVGYHAQLERYHDRKLTLQRPQNARRSDRQRRATDVCPTE
ncbi:MAG: ABC transporter ATP-binding protein/permease [Pseudomonadota bacterium]